MNQQSIGMMQGAFFVPKGQILNWINGLCGLSLTRIQQLGTGAAYCQIFDLMFPGKLKIGKINWKAKNDWQFLSNLKLLQNGFQRCGIKKYIQVEKLSRAKYQDNLQFAQWFKRFYDLNPPKVDIMAPIKKQVDFTFIQKRQFKTQKRYKLQRSISPKRFSANKKRNFSLKKVQFSQHPFQQIEKLLKGDMSQASKLKGIQTIIKQARRKDRTKKRIPSVQQIKQELQIQ